jgi:hypothetical protein
METGISLYRSPMEKLEGGSFTSDSEIQMKEGSGNGASLYGSSSKGTQWEGSSTEGLERYIKEGSGEGHLFP